MTASRILVLTPMNMTERNGMMQRQEQWLRYLARRYPGRVDLLSLAQPRAVARRWLVERGIDANVIGGAAAIWWQLQAEGWRLIGYLLCNRLGWVRAYPFPFRWSLPRALQRRYAVIISYYPWLYHLFRIEAASPAAIVDLGDVMSHRHERIGVRRWISLSRDVERQIIGGRARCLAISTSDAAEFEQLYGVRLPVLPFVPPNAEALAEIPPARSARTLGFLAAPGHQNEGVIALLSHPGFLSRLRQEGITLRIAGTICDTLTNQQRTAFQSQGVEIVGPMANTSAFYASVGVILNPVGPTTGMKIKSVEALMAGRRLVTTAWGIDQVLQEMFAGQITIVPWPIDAEDLASVCGALVQASAPPPAANAARYLAHCQEAMRALIDPLMPS